MKVGIIFKKEFQDKYGTKKEFFGDEIIIREEVINYEHMLTISGHFEKDSDMFTDVRSYPTNSIQLLYLGGWKN